MSARERLERICGPQTPPELIAELDAYRTEVLAEDGQAYDGELAMFRGLVRTLRAVSRDDRADVAQREVRRLLYEHAADERDAYRRESNPTPADVTPDFFQPGHTYTREHHASTIQFLVRYVDNSPKAPYRIAFGWRTEDGDVCASPFDSDDFTGWTDTTEGGAVNE